MGAPPTICDRVAIALLGADPRVRQLTDGSWALVPEAQGSPLLDDCAFAVVDVETTGMRSGGGDRITEIAVAVVHGERREIVFESLVNPERPIPRAVCAITNITNEMVRHAPRFADLAERLLAALAGRVFVAHNARFDWNFVSAGAAAHPRPHARRQPVLHRSAGPPAGEGGPLLRTGQPLPLLRLPERGPPPGRRGCAGHGRAAVPAAEHRRERKAPARSRISASSRPGGSGPNGVSVVPCPPSRGRTRVQRS